MLKVKLHDNLVTATAPVLYQKALTLVTPTNAVIYVELLVNVRHALITNRDLENVNLISRRVRHKNNFQAGLIANIISYTTTL